MTNNWTRKNIVGKDTGARVSSKKSNFFFGSNRKKPKLNLLQLFFGLFRETPQKIFRFVSVFRTGIQTTETNRTLSKQTKLISRKRSLLGVLKKFGFFTVRTEKKLNSICFGCFLFFSQNKKKIFGLFRFVSVFQTGI